MVEIYINNILIKKVYSEIINNLTNEYLTYIYPYNIVDSTYPLTPNTKITIKIFDLNQIDDVYFNVILEKNDSKKAYDEYFLETNSIEFVCTTHELLYEGIESDIMVNFEYGYYSDIYFVCENILDNISSISLTNTDVILLDNIPSILLDHSKNLILYSLKVNENFISGIKIDGNNFLKIKLNKSNPNSKIKIYGNKLFIIKKGDK
jgi:hypothetical protein